MNNRTVTTSPMLITLFLLIALVSHARGSGFLAQEMLYTSLSAGSAGLPPSDGAAISGRVVDGSSQIPLQGMKVTVSQTELRVELYEAVSGKLFSTAPVTPVENRLLQSVTQADGTYSVSGLMVGNYTVQVEDPNGSYLPQYYAETAVSENATIVNLGQGAAIGNIDFSLAAGGVISGTIRALTDNQPLEGITVVAQDTATGRQAASSITGPQGEYLLQGLTTSTYRVQAKGGSGLVDLYFPESLTATNANPVEVTAGQTSPQVDLSLYTYSTISGRLLDESGAPLAGITVEAYDFAAWRAASARALARAQSDADGAYQLINLKPGSYFVKALPSETYFKQLYDGKEEGQEPTPVELTPGQAMDGIDFSLRPGAPAEEPSPEEEPAGDGVVSGQLLRAKDQSPLENGCVYAYDTATNRITGSDCSGSDGRYRISGLPEAEYRLCVRVPAGGYISTCYGDVFYVEANKATPVTVRSKEEIINIDIRLAMFAGLKGAIIRSPEMEAIGGYEIKNIPPGQYVLKVKAEGSGYQDRWHPQASSMETATQITVEDGQVVEGTDVVLEVE